MGHVEDAVRMWENVRAGVIAELENIPDTQWEFRPGSGARTVRELGRHIAVMGIGFTDELLKPDGTFMKLARPDVQAQLDATLPATPSREELLGMLRRSGVESAARLRGAGEELASQTMPGMAGPQSRLLPLWFAVSHEMYHRGQVAMCARTLGHVPMLTRQIQAMAAGPAAGNR